MDFFMIWLRVETGYCYGRSFYYGIPVNVPSSARPASAEKYVVNTHQPVFSVAGLVRVGWWKHRAGPSPAVRTRTPVLTFPGTPIGPLP